MAGRLYFGDNLYVLREYVKDETVDLIYLDPPFNSQATYNVLFRSPAGERSVAQIRAFEDTWRWDKEAEAALDDVRQRSIDTFNLLLALKSFLGESDVMAYLAMMAPRLLELRRVLKPTGTLYLHCDPTASHYLKIVLDGVFGADCFQNEIIWKRTSAHSSAKRYGPVHDVLLFYSKGDEFTWNKVYQPYDDDYIETFFDQTDEDGRRWKRTDLTGAGTRNGETGKPWRGINVTAKGRHWAYPPSQLEKLDAAGKIHWPKKLGGMPRLKQYPEDLPGVPLQDIWADIRPLHNLSDERLHYPTQKPLALIERIIRASSNEGDVVLDPFCGCGTAVHAAERLKRQWIGIDITYLAIQVIEDRLKTWLPRTKYDVKGIPHDETAARGLARRDPYQFQLWAVGRLGGQARGKGADRGIDGEVVFLRGLRDYGRAIVSVKGGENVHPDDVRALKGTVDRERADMGIFVCLDEPTKEMKKEAATGGLIELPGGKRPRFQIVTVDELIRGPSLGIVTGLNFIQAAEAARAQDRRGPKKQSATDLRRQPQIKLPIAGGRQKSTQKDLPLGDELLTPQVTPRVRRRSAG